MDQKLQKARRDALSDPEAKDRYIAILERLAGVNHNEVKIWIAHYTPPESLHGYGFSVAIAFTKKQAQREAAEMLITMVCDTAFPEGEEKALNNPDTLPFEEWDEMDQLPYNYLKELRELFEVEKYQEIIDSYTQHWDTDCAVELYDTNIA